jgi:hypothetical protein
MSDIDTTIHWSYLYRLESGHRVFLAPDGRRAVADNSGRTPEQTDNGTLWFDKRRAILLGTSTASVPVRTDKGATGVIRVTPRDVALLFQDADWRVEPTNELGETIDVLRAVGLL